MPIVRMGKNVYLNNKENTMQRKAEKILAWIFISIILSLMWYAAADIVI
jgi:hypothetical protein